MYSACELTALMNQISHVCRCVPEYIPNVRDMINNPLIKGCNFYEHATCVAYVHEYFDPGAAQCLPACLDSYYQQSRITVTQLYQSLIMKNILVYATTTC